MHLENHTHKGYEVSSCLSWFMIFLFQRPPVRTGARLWLTAAAIEDYYSPRLRLLLAARKQLTIQQFITRHDMKNAAMIFWAWLILAGAAVAQTEMPKPGPEHKKLDMFAGTWTLEGEMKPTAMGPGGKATENEKCEWMEGGFFLVCRMDFKSSMGDGAGITIMGYSSDDKSYSYREFNSWGEFTDSKGSVDGDTWTWINEEKMGGTMMKGRFTMKITSPAAYNFSYEMSPDGTKWTMVMDGKATKGK